MYRAFTYAASGLRAVWKEERNFRIQVAVGILVCAGMAYFGFSAIESAICFVAIALVLCGEIVNTALEDLCDKVEPNRDPAIGKIKDMMAAYALVSSLGALLAGILILKNHL